MAALANKRRETEVFSLAFLDCICCGFGAVLLVFILTVSQKKNVDRADVDLARDRLAQARAASSASEADLDRLARVLPEPRARARDMTGARGAEPVGHFDADGIGAKCFQ